MNRPLADYRIVDLGELLYPPSPDNETYWSLCEATVSEVREQGGPECSVERVRVTHPGWSMDWLGIGIVKKPTDVIPTCPQERAVLLSLTDGGIVYPLAHVAADAGVPLSRTRKIVRSFRDKGLAEFGWLYNEDEGKLHGQGYWLSGRGVALKERALEEEYVT